MAPTTRLLAALLFAIPSALPACAYWKDRGRDAARVLEFDMGVGMGLEGHLGVSHVAELGAGWYTGRRWGLREGGLVTIEEERAEFGIPILYLHEVSQESVAGGMPGRARALPLDVGYERYPLQWFSGRLIDRDPLDLHAGAHAVVLGANVSVRVLAIADFLLGFVGIDFRRDDLAGVTQEELLQDLRSPDALVRRRAVDLLQEMTGRRWPEYQTPTQRYLYPAWERAVLSDIEKELRGASVGPSAAHATVSGVPASILREEVPPPTEAAPLAPKPSAGP